LSPRFFELILQPIDPGHIDVTWSWNNNFDLATSTQDTANLAAMNPGGAGADTEALASGAAGDTAVDSSEATSAVVPDATAVVAGADGAVALVEPSATEPSASAATTSVASTPSANPGRPTGYGRGSRQRRCNAQL